jgi:hypothetical protein
MHTGRTVQIMGDKSYSLESGLEETEASGIEFGIVDRYDVSDT